MTTAHNRRSAVICGIAIGAVTMALPLDLQGLTVQVRDPSGNPVSGFRWLLEEDNTNQPTLGLSTANVIALDIHQSHAPVVDAGHSATDSATIAVADPTKRYFVSVLPDAGYTMGGTMAPDANGTVTVIVNSYPIPTAQITVLVFHDNSPIDNAPNLPFEQGLAGFTVIIADALGNQMMDVFGNPLGTEYVYNPGTGQYEVPPGGMGSGYIVTDQNGEAVIKNIAQGKYAVNIVPPAGENWIQTTTIEGTPVIDAWVKAGEGPLLVEFGPAFSHIFMGFVQEFDQLATLPNPGGQTGSITGRLVYSHTSRPPIVQGFFSGPAVEGGLFALNSGGSGVYVGRTNGEGVFTVNNVPPGVYQLVTWDANLDAIIGFHTVSLPDLQGNMNQDLGDVQCFAWFGNLEGSVFYDEDSDGFRDPNEMGIPDQAVNLRFRDGRIYQATATDPMGNYGLNEVFPFFKWLIVEVDFLRYRDTGYTNVVDYGGEIPADAGWDMPSFGKLNPQPQADVNVNTGNNLSRTEIADAPGATLLQAMQDFAGQTNIIDWGKRDYNEGESGGISGIVYYAVTRAEEDPAFAVGEDWEPGIPRIQVSLYEDLDSDAVIDDLDGDGGPTLADRDNAPLGWSDGTAPKGDEDIDWDGDGVFDPGDAIQIVHTDSWDDNQPGGCIQPPVVVNGELARECYDNFGTWNQIRPGVFDGGYAIGSHFPGGMANGGTEVDGLPLGVYIVEAATPKGYELVKEEDKNVDFGDEYVPSTGGGMAPMGPLPPPTPPPACVGDDHLVPDVLSLFPTIEAPFAGQTRQLCDRKQVAHADGQNTAANFFLFTYVPKAARAVGIITNDLAAEGNPSSPLFGEKQGPSWIPISWQDFAGNEFMRTYTDEFGSYNALLPSSYSVNIPAPSGVAPHMISYVLNHPGPIPDPNNPGQMMIDPLFDPGYTQTRYTFNFGAGAVTYLDTPVIPVAAFLGFPNRVLDAEPPDHTPVLYSVMGPTGGPVVCVNKDRIQIRSRGQTQVANPNHDLNDPNSPLLITRDYGFGRKKGKVTVNGVSLDVKTWTEVLITAEVEIGKISTGQLIVQRGDNLAKTLPGITLHVGNCGNVVHVRGGGSFPATPIQDAIDSAAPGSLIIVEPGTYDENVIIWKNVQLQGAGAGSTILNGAPVPATRVSDWHTKLEQQLITNGDVTPILNDHRFFTTIEAPAIFLLTNPGTFTAGSPGRVDGFQIIGANAGGGVYVNGYGEHTHISNNRIANNQGSSGGAVTVGTSDILAPVAGIDSFNDSINIHHNWIAKNGGIRGGGGVTIFTGADQYTVSDNMIIGCFTQFAGGGICHSGLSNGGTIARNTVLFNEVFYGGLVGGDGGGIYIGGNAANPQEPGSVGAGSGSVLVDANIIRGNLAGSGSGGGLRAININGDDALGAPNTWYRLDVVNNIIANNVAAYQGGGIALHDAARVNIIHNTIANNDSTATGSLAFPPGDLLHSLPQPAGIVSTPHSPPLALASGQQFSNPVLYNNIIWHNRSFSWDGTLNGQTGGLVPRTPLYWDLQVIGTGSLNPQFCTLTDTTGYAVNNRSADPGFLDEYFNNLVGIGLLEEGGNAVTIRHTNLDQTAGNYHIPNNSPVVNAATQRVPVNLAALKKDVDGDKRPNGGRPDIGADEWRNK